MFTEDVKDNISSAEQSAWDAEAPDRRPLLVVVEGTDAVSGPIGGQFTMTRQILFQFSEAACLIGMSMETRDIGRWSVRQLGGRKLRCFSVCVGGRDGVQPWVPLRLRFLIGLWRYRHRIRASISISDCICFTLSPEALLGVFNLGWADGCHKLSGTANPISISRYRWARGLAPVFEFVLYWLLSRVSTVLAAADREAIAQFESRSEGRVARGKVIQCPTRVDEAVFYPRDKMTCRRQLGIGAQTKVLVTVSRLNEEKGIDLLIRTVLLLAERYEPDCVLLVVGTGEHKANLEKIVADCSSQRLVRFLGSIANHEIPDILSAADVYVSGSRHEGWPTSIVESLACGLPVVSTKVSGVGELIEEGVNGMVVLERSEVCFCEAIIHCFSLRTPVHASLQKAGRYQLAGFAAELVASWPSLERFMMRTIAS